MQPPGNMTPDAHPPVDDSNLQVRATFDPHWQRARTPANLHLSFIKQHRKPRYPTRYDIVLKIYIVTRLNL